MKKSSSRPRLSQPSGDGSQTVAFFFHNAHFPIIGELSKKQVVNVGQQLTFSSVSWTFFVFLLSKSFSQNVADIEIFTREPHFLPPLKHFQILGELSKKWPTNHREQPTLSHVLLTFGCFYLSWILHERSQCRHVPRREASCQNQD